MRGRISITRRNRAKRILFACSVTMAMLVASVATVGVIGETADARGPAYNGPQTQSTGPAYFGPAPNPYPYCDSPTYFDPFPENVNPIGRMDVGDTASVTTGGVTMDLVITSEGNPGTQYPGFFPAGGDGGSNDQPKGIELAEGDGATVTLSAPLFYSQWIFTDVDQPNEGFTVTPLWTVPGEAAVFSGDSEFTFAGTTNNSVELDDTNGVSEVSQSINGRAQVDFLGAVTGIEMLRTEPSNGQSGFAVGGGCEAVGAAKALVAGPTWNGTGFDVTYELRMRNNLPSSSTIQSVINDAVANAGASLVTGTPQGIVLTDLQLTDDLRDPAFSNIEVTSLTTSGGLTLNPNFDGVTDFNLLSSGAIAAESSEVLTLSVSYTPDISTGNWSDCATGYDYLNQTQVTAVAAGVPVEDLSDDGFSAQPNNNNGSGGVDDPTPVKFPCPPGGLEIVKTVVVGPDGTCPTFENGIPGDGPALPVTVDDVVTYCVSVRNPGPGAITNVVVTDPQAPGVIPMPNLAAGETSTTSYDVQVDLSTPTQNTATATANDVTGPIDPVQDTAIIVVSPKDQPLLEIVKTVVNGPDGTCPSFENGVQGLGPALPVDTGDVVTYCISVRNVGPGTATGVVISDDQAPQDYQVGTLASGEGTTVSYDLTVDPTTPPVNTADGNYSGPDGPRDEVSDDAQIVVRPPDPVLEIVKTVVLGPDGTCPTFANGVQGPGDPLTVATGQTVTYCVAIQNTGAGDATNVEISDDQAPNGVIVIGSLPSGEGRVVQYDVVVDESTPLRNVATVTGDGPDGPTDPDDDDALIDTPSISISLIHSVSKADQECITVAKNLNSLVANNEDLPITWCALITNTGSFPLTNVVLQAPDIGDGEPVDVMAGELSPVLLPGESVRVEVPGTIPDTGLISNAVVTADASDTAGNVLDGADQATDDDNAEVREASINIDTTVAAGADADCATAVEVLLIPEDRDITWCFVVTNTGAVDLLITRVTDPVLGITALVPADQQILRVGTSILLSANDVSSDGRTIDADVKGKPLDFDGSVLDEAPEVEDIDPAQVIAPLADLAITKDISNPVSVNVGEVVTYTLVITNNGPDYASGVVVTDRLPTGIAYVTLPGEADWACALDADQRGFSCLKGADFDAGDSVTLTYTAIINAAAPVGTDLTNTAIVSSETPDEDPTNNEDTSTTRRPPAVPVTPTDPTPPDPGPFTPPPPVAPAEPDEVLGLAITGSSSSMLGMLSAAMLVIGGLFTVGSRRKRDEEL